MNNDSQVTQTSKRILRPNIKPTRPVWTCKILQHVRFNSSFPFNPSARQTNACINKILINKIRREYLQPIRNPPLEALRYERPRIPVDPIRNRLDAQNRVIRLRSNRIFNPVKMPPVHPRLLLPQMLQIALKLRRREVGVDPVVFQVTRPPKRATRFRLGRLPRLPHANDPLR